MINLKDEFPVEELSNYFVGRGFIRVSPITGAEIKGTVKTIRVVYEGELTGSNFRPVINVTSTNDVTYDYNELFFSINDRKEKRTKLFMKFLEEEEERKIKMVGDI